MIYKCFMVHADIVYIPHIIDAITRIGENLQGIHEDVFLRNYLVQDGVIRQLEIIGEATKQISQETRENIKIFHGKIWHECGTNSFTITLAWMWNKFG